MKRLLLLALVLAMLTVPVAGLSLTLQNANDLNSIHTDFLGTHTISWVHNTTGGNSYVLHDGGYWGNKNPQLTGYVGFTTTNVGSGACAIRFYDSSLTSLGAISVNTAAAGSRIESTTDSTGVTKVYVNGLSPYTFPSSFSTYPSYVASACGLDNFVYGSSENRYIFGVPEQGNFIIKKDVAGVTGNGFAYSNGTVISISSMDTQWARSNITYAGNESIVLRSTSDQTIYQTRYTNTATFGTANWSISDFITSAAPYGLYEITIPGSGSVSLPVVYTSAGATVTLDKSEYSTGDSAVATYDITPTYWDPSAYTYRLDTVDVYGNVIDTQTITTASGSNTITFSSSDPLGVYYTVIIADPIADGSNVWLAYDYSELNGYIIITGDVNDAETALPISGANVTVAQGSIISYTTTIADGNYTTSGTGLFAGISTILNVTATGYSQYNVSITFGSAKTYSVNVTLNSTTPTYTGLGIGGVVRDGTFDGMTITNGYGRPISGATISIINTTNGESYTKTTNMAGWYLCDEGSSCFLSTKRPYDVWGNKTGFKNSVNYTVVTL